MEQMINKVEHVTSLAIPNGTRQKKVRTLVLSSVWGTQVVKGSEWWVFLDWGMIWWCFGSIRLVFESETILCQVR